MRRMPGAGEATLDSRRRRRLRIAIEQPFPHEWSHLLEQRWAIWSMLAPDERQRLGRLIQAFVADKRWEAANNFALTDEMQVLVAAQACLLILNLDHDYYRGVGAIIMHPTTVVLRGQRPIGASGIVSDGPFPILGQAQFRGPVMIAWDAANRDARDPERGHNVVFHEFAHKLDMLDGTVDGTPPLRDQVTRQRWIDVCTHEYELLRAGQGGPLLSDYAGVNPGEFFAVATQVFFSRGPALLADRPELYGVLSGFYQQDPAAR